MRIDVNCDGRLDAVFTGRTNVHHVIAAAIDRPGGAPKISHVEFALTGASQDALCGVPEPLREELLTDDIVEQTAVAPEGIVRSKRCVGLELRSGECDAFHIFWNHKANELSWWHL